MIQARDVREAADGLLTALREEGFDGDRGRVSRAEHALAAALRGGTAVSRADAIAATPPAPTPASEDGLRKALVEIAERCEEWSAAAVMAGQGEDRFASEIAEAARAALRAVPAETPASEDGLLLELAWGVIANAGDGNWPTESAEWQDAAVRWRDRYFARLAATTELLASPDTGVVEGAGLRPDEVGLAFKTEMARRDAVASLREVRRNLGALIQLMMREGHTPADNEYLRLAIGANLVSLTNAEQRDADYLSPESLHPLSRRRAPLDVERLARAKHRRAGHSNKLGSAQCRCWGEAYADIAEYARLASDD